MEPLHFLKRQVKVTMLSFPFLERVSNENDVTVTICYLVSNGNDVTVTVTMPTYGYVVWLKYHKHKMYVFLNYCLLRYVAS
jgi:hypothetical protein